MDIVTTVGLIAAIATVTATGIAVLPWREEEIDAAGGAIRSVAAALGGALGPTVGTDGIEGADVPVRARIV